MIERGTGEREGKKKRLGGCRIDVVDGLESFDFKRTKIFFFEGFRCCSFQKFHQNRKMGDDVSYVNAVCGFAGKGRRLQKLPKHADPPRVKAWLVVGEASLVARDSIGRLGGGEKRAKKCTAARR